MKSLAKLVLILAFIGLPLAYSPKAHALPAKVKTLLLTSTYGAIGGALLGTAALAFGGRPIGIARGASFGLYAGIIFGAYIIIAHEYSKGDYQGSSADDDTYEDGDDYAEEEEVDDEQANLWNPYKFHGQTFERLRMSSSTSVFSKTKKRDVPIFYLNVINWTF